MSTITQRIPNLLQGISQQPDNRKFLGQLRDSVNAFPDYALGLLKRPGGKYISELYGASTSGKWFSILRDQQEKYVAQYDDNTFRVWSLIDGSPRAVDMGDAAPGSCNLVNLKADLAAYNAAVDLTATRLAELHEAQATYKEVLDGQTSTEQELFQVNYTYPVSSIEQYLVSGILLKANGVYVVKNNNAVIQATTTLPANYALGNEVTDEHPLLAAQGNRVYQTILTVAAEFNSGDLSTAESAMNTAQTNYDNAVAAEAVALAAYQAELDNCEITTLPSTNYLHGATAEDIELLTLNDYTFVLNKAKTVELLTDTVDKTAAKPNEAFVVIRVVGTGHYKIYLDGTERASYNAGSGGDVDQIVSDLVGDLNGQTFGGKTYSATAVGPGLYISCTADFSISVVGAPSEDAMFVFQDTTPTVANLPLQCKNGFKVKVVNSLDIDVDDMYVNFVTDSGGTYGPGTWEESNGWELAYQFDPTTMPHQLVRQADGSFSFDPITWGDRDIGDEETNPSPSFVNSTISNVFFYRNRLGFLSGETVVLSRAGNYFNFWATTALTVSDDDPIDISASSIKPVNLRYVRPTSVGLVLFSDTEQFILSTDSDILSPNTSKINELSSYECDRNVEAVTLGTSLAFISKTPLYTRLYELFSINTTSPPFMYEQTKIVPELIPQTVDSMISSPALSIVSLGTVGSNTIYQYKFLQQGEQRSISTWYKWVLTGNLLDQFFDVSTYYAVVSSGTSVYVQSYDLTQASEEGYLTLPTGEKTDVCLDLWSINPYREYDPDGDGSDVTRIYLPYEEIAAGTFYIVLLGRYIGANDALTSASVGALLTATVEGSAGAYYVDIDGDYRGRDLIIGYNYSMEVELPKFYVSKSENQTAVSDFTSDLIIHRIKVSTGLSGPVKYDISITGRPEWSNTIEAVAPYAYNLNNVNMSADAVHTVPIYQRNENLSIRIIGDTALPVSILSLNWEGKYNTGFYRRA